MNIVQQYNMCKNAKDICNNVQKEINVATNEVRGRLLWDGEVYSLQTVNYNITAMSKGNKYAAKVRPVNSDKKLVITGKRANMLCGALFIRFFYEARARELKALRESRELNSLQK